MGVVVPAVQKWPTGQMSAMGVGLVAEPEQA